MQAPHEKTYFFTDTRNKARSITTERILTSSEKDLLHKILCFFPHADLEADWPETFDTFDAANFPADLVKLAANARDNYGYTMLSIVACHASDPCALLTLIHLGADPNGRDTDGKAVIFWAIDNRKSVQDKTCTLSVVILQLLLNADASRGVEFENMTPAAWAKHYNYSAALFLLEGSRQFHLAFCEIEDAIHSVKDLIYLQNVFSYWNNTRVIDAISPDQLRKVISDRDALNRFFKNTTIFAHTFHWLVHKLSPGYLQKMFYTGFDSSFNWLLLLSHIPAQFRTPLTLLEDMLNHIHSCQDLDEVLTCLNETDHPLLYEKLGNRLKKIANNYFSLRFISKKFLPELLKKLGDTHIAASIDSGYCLLEALAYFREEERPGFLARFSPNSLRGYFYEAANINQLFQLMPPHTHAKLKLTLHRWNIAMNIVKQPSNFSLKKKQILELKNSKTDFTYISSPIQLDEAHIMGMSSNKKRGQCQSLVIYNQFSDVMVFINNEDFCQPVILDAEKKIYFAWRFNHNHCVKLAWQDNRLSVMKNGYIKWHSHNPKEGELLTDMIRLPDGKWLLLNQDVHNIIGGRKGWHLDVLEPETFQFKRVYTGDREKFNLISQLTLLPDGKTVLGWHDIVVKQSVDNLHDTNYRVCFINLETFEIEAKILPIDPKKLEGSIKAIHMDVSEITIVIESRKKNFHFYSLQYSRVQIQSSLIHASVFKPKADIVEDFPEPAPKISGELSW